MSDIQFLIHEGSVDDPMQTGICFQVTDGAFYPVGHHQIVNEVPRDDSESLISALTKLPLNVPGRIEPSRSNSFRVVDGRQSRGEYFPRIDRPILGEKGPHGQEWRRLIDPKALQGIRKQFDILVGMLEDVLRVVHPCVENYGAYGHTMRNLMMIAATEFESSCVAVLAGNGVLDQHARPSTRDYVKLMKPLGLDKYSVGFRDYPWLGDFVPFDGWLESSPTQSLCWYYHYNKVKHNREANIHHARLEYVLLAVTAVYVMNLAQFAEVNVYSPYMHLHSSPAWGREDVYIPPLDCGEWRAGSLSL